MCCSKRILYCSVYLAAKASKLNFTYFSFELRYGLTTFAETDFIGI